jgi:hypothetical protein
MAHNMANAAVQAGHFQVADAQTDDMQTDLQQWKPILDWLQPYLGAGAAVTGMDAAGGGTPNMAPQTASSQPATRQTTTTHQTPATGMASPAMAAATPPPLASRLMNSRQPAPVTRIGSPRVLDRVGGGVLRGGTAATPSLPQAPQPSETARVEDAEDDLAHIPAFLKLVKA